MCKGRNLWPVLVVLLAKLLSWWILIILWVLYASFFSFLLWPLLHICFKFCLFKWGSTQKKEAVCTIHSLDVHHYIAKLAVYITTMMSRRHGAVQPSTQLKPSCSIVQHAFSICTALSSTLEKLDSVEDLMWMLMKEIILPCTTFNSKPLNYVSHLHTFMSTCSSALFNATHHFFMFMNFLVINILICLHHFYIVISLQKCSSKTLKA